MLGEFKIAVPGSELADLAGRLDATRWPAGVSPGWRDGVDLGFLIDLVEHWRTGFDWRQQERSLNQFRQLRGPVGGTTLHVVHERGRGPRPFPLLLVHGWPDSVFRFAKLIPLLTDPAAHGAGPADAFDIVAPGLPGFGWSLRDGPDAHLFGFGRLFATLMAELGYTRYGAHGGDLGSGVCERLAQARPEAVAAIHLTDVPGLHAAEPPSDPSAAEQAYLDQVARFRQDGGGYAHIQATRPGTPAVGLADSPAGLAAWIIEKFHGWSDRRAGFESAFTRDELLTNVMIYWVTRSIGTSFLAYRDASQGAPPAPVAPKPVAGFALFPADIAQPPRAWAERFFDVRSWTEMPAGGHFAALERPDLLAADMRRFFRPFR